MSPSNKKKSKAKPAKPATTTSSTDSPPPLPTLPANSDSSPTTPALSSPTTLDPQLSLSSAMTAPPPSSNLFDFETFIDIADLDDIIRFCDAVASTKDGRNLKLLWDRAFEAGLDQGRTEEWRRGDEDRKEMYFKGKAKGIEEAEEAARRAEIDLYSHGKEKGTTEERLEWTSADHGPHCLATTTILSDASIQTDSESSIPATCDANVQACRPVANASAQTLTTVDYDSPMDPSSTDNLCSRAATASSETPLGTVWKRAFKAGQDDASRLVDGLQVSDMLKLGFEKSQVHGIIQEREQWETAGHGQTCFVAACSSIVTADAGTQVDLVTPLPLYTNASVQAVSADIQISTSCADASSQTSTDFNPLNNAESVDLLCALSAVAPSETPLGLVWRCAFKAGSRLLQVNISDEPVIPPRVDTSIQTLELPISPSPKPEPETPKTTGFDWAEEVESLPTAPSLPPTRQARDLSVLRSSSPAPFSSLQRRAKPSGIRSSHQSRRRHRPFHSEFPNPPIQPRRSPIYVPPSRRRAHQRPSVLKPIVSPQNPTRLDWESDPRLSDLSRALKALGWMRPP